jgi:hypothetical protein
VVEVGVGMGMGGGVTGAAVLGGRVQGAKKKKNILRKKSILLFQIILNDCIKQK